LAVERHFSVVGRYLARCHTKAGRFASAVRAKQAHDFAGIDIKINSIDDFPAAVVFNEAANFQDGHRLSFSNLTETARTEQFPPTGYIPWPYGQQEQSKMGDPGRSTWHSRGLGLGAAQPKAM
jgi:hypothetical protein